MTLDQLNTAPRCDARVALGRCCGSSAWVEAMIAERPFADRDILFEVAKRVWRGCSQSDWLEAFTHHPQIGELERLGDRFRSTRRWAEGEQAGVDQAAEEVLEALREANRQYWERFGYIFIVCASGKTAPQMLDLLWRRLRNDPEKEILVAAGEQEKITRLRLEKLLQNPE